MLNWIGTISGMTGALILAMGFAKIGYPCFLVGSIIWFIDSIRNRNKPAIVQWGFFLGCNILGVYNAFA